jgi:hypothetical protein
VLLGYEYVTEGAEQCKKQGPRIPGFKGSSEKETNVAAGFSLRCFDIHQREIAKEVLQRMDSPLP